MYEACFASETARRGSHRAQLVSWRMAGGFIA
jgi:hypothetical protein